MYVYIYIYIPIKFKVTTRRIRKLLGPEQQDPSPFPGEGGLRDRVSGAGLSAVIPEVLAPEPPAAIRLFLLAVELALASTSNHQVCQTPSPIFRNRDFTSLYE